MTLNKTNPRYPLSSPQREIWFDQLRHANTPLYNIGGYMRIEGAIQPRLFEKAINRVVQENEALRTILHQDAPLPTQSFPENVELKVDFQDFSSEENPHQHAIKWMENELVKPFQLYEGLLLKFALLKISPECYYGYSQYHHLITDGWGISLISRRVADTYNTLLIHQSRRGEQTDYSYRDFIQYDQQYLTSEAYQRDERYWRQKYQNRPEPVIPHRYANQFNGTVPSQRQILSIKLDLYRRLTAFADKNHATTYHLILGALYCYFIRTSNTEELAIGLSVLNRKTAAFKRTVGLFTSIIPARFSFGTDLNFVDLIHAIGMELRQEYRHQRFPMSEIVKSVTTHSQTPLFDIVMAYQKHDYPAKFAGKPAQVETLTNGFEHNTLFISVEEYQQNRDVRLTFDYQRDAFNEAEMALFAARFEWILESILQKPNIPIWKLNIMPDAERRKIVKFNDTSQYYPSKKTIIDIFEEQVEKQPLNIAIVFQGQQVTYQELNSRANQLAYFLQTLGVQLETLVGLCVERSVEMVYGLLAILKAGGAYVPLDPRYPPERIAFMLEDSQVQVLLTQQKLMAHLPESKAQLVLLDTEPEKQQISPSKRVAGVQPRNLAYVIYTSGSTGQPKGVIVAAIPAIIRVKS